MVFFESRDCFKTQPPLSSFRIRYARDEVSVSKESRESWDLDLRRAVSEAARKLKKPGNPVKQSRRKPSGQRSGEWISGGDRVEGNNLESCIW